MFFGIGAYGVALALFTYGATWSAIALGLVVALPVAALLALGDRPVLAAGAGDLLRDDHARGRLGLRGAGLATVMADRRRGRPHLPACRNCCARARPVRARAIFGVAFNGRAVTYYLVFVACVLLFLLLLRIVNSPFGRVLQAIRENPFRAEALGYRTVVHRTLANCIAALVAAAAGALNALWLRYTGPDTTLSFSIMLDILLMVVIGGMGTMYGAVIGAHAVTSWRRTICRR